MMWGGYGGWGWGLGMIHGLVWLTLVVLGIVVLVRILLRGSASVPTQPHAAPGTALDILKKRYASGEIDKAEFDAKRQDLAQ